MNTEQTTFSFASSFRIDVKCIEDDCINIEALNCKISKPSWFQINGGGYVVEGKSEEETIRIKINKKCKLSFKFRGPDIRIKNVKVPVWVNYKSILFNNKELLDTPILCWHDVPYSYSLDFNEARDIIIKIVQTPYSYTKKEFLNGILAINSKLIEAKFEDFIQDFKSSTLINKIENFWEFRSHMLTMTSSQKENAIREYYSYLEKKNSWIGHGANILSEPIFPHGLSGIFISGGAKIGKNCVIFQQVTIGSNTLSDSSSKGAPTIGDNVYIGAGAKIIGKVTIGDNVRIGANAVVITDIPDNSVVVMNKPRIIHKDNMDNKFYHILNGIYGYHLDGQFFPVKESY